MSLTWGSAKFSSETGKSSITTQRFFAAMLYCHIESVGVCNNRGMLRKTVQSWDKINTIWPSNKRMYQRFYPKSDQTLINLCLKFHHFSSCRPDFCLGHDCESFENLVHWSWLQRHGYWSIFDRWPHAPMFLRDMCCTFWHLACANPSLYNSMKWYPECQKHPYNPIII